MAATRAKYLLLLASAEMTLVGDARFLNKRSCFLTAAVMKELNEYPVDAQELVDSRGLLSTLVCTPPSKHATVELMRSARRLLPLHSPQVRPQRAGFTVIF